MSGRRWGWVGGFLGASSWVPVLAVLLFMGGDALGGGLMLAAYGLCLVMLRLFLPWRRPQKRLAGLYAVTIAPVLLAAALLFVRVGGDLPRVQWLQAALLLPLFLVPVLVLGRKTWADPWPGQAQSDRDGGGGT